jgi:hypothetical protein
MINKQNRSKVFLAIIGILLVANIALISFLILKKDDGRRDKRIDKKVLIGNFLKNEIGFDNLQLQEYDTLSTRHADNMKRTMDSLRSAKENQFKELAAAGFSDSAIGSVAERSASTQKTMELRMFNHIRKIRLLCKPGQLPKFDSLFGKMLNRRGGEQQKKQSDK